MTDELRQTVDTKIKLLLVLNNIYFYKRYTLLLKQNINYTFSELKCDFYLNNILLTRFM